MKFALVALLTSALAISGCAAEFSGNESDAPPAEPVVGLGTEASAHLKGGKNAKPAFTDLGLALSAAAAVSGLGNGDIVVELSAVGQPISTCTNPAGSTQPPGQNPAEVTLTGTQAIPASAIKNGTVSFDVRTGAPNPIVAGAPGCPNAQWQQAITDVSFSRATLTVQQSGATVLTVTCTFSPSTANGAVPAGSVTCS